MSLRRLFISVLLASQAIAQLASSSSSSSSSSASSSPPPPSSSSATSSATLASASATAIATSASLSTISHPSVVVPSGSYISYSSTITRSSSSSAGNGTASSSSLLASNNGTSTSSASTTTTSKSFLVTASRPASASTGSSTTSSTAPSNTAACNNYPEFCTRKYSNITQVCAHNSAFAVANNLFSNQEFSITGQLNDGIRMIQGETHLVNGTMRNCHTDCSFLDAGPYSSLLLEVREWLDRHPYDVVTLLIVNSDYVDVHNYTSAFASSGMLDYVYTPPKIPMALADWPTLSELILTNKRAIVFMDYQANQTAVPYILDEFSQMVESPFSPTNASFPCNAQRPPGISQADANARLVLANHNLNVGISLSGAEILIPNFADLAQVNAANGTASLGEMAQTCTDLYNRPPNFLLVDYYNLGNYSVGGGQLKNGSVFEVAARMNGVVYNRNCCGMDTMVMSGAKRVGVVGGTVALLAAVAVGTAMM